ncbi:MAG TPA: glycosyltransferase family 1 protein [Azospirillaceae bacterium]|nr:glycosyltransferase family 1 protein [Azospirillaceae bacterium]
MPFDANAGRKKAPSGTTTPLVINGRFLSQSLTGVQRYARELVLAMDKHLAASPGRFGPVTLHLPPDAAGLPGLAAIAQRTVGRRRGQAWEQLDLPRSARGARLLSLGNAAPFLHPRQVVVLHDAGVYAVPESYTPAFRLWYRLQFGWLARNAERIVTVSAFSAGELARHAGVRRDRLAVVPNAAEHLDGIQEDPSVLSRHGLAPQGYVLAIGSAKPHKNLAAVAAAVGMLPEPRPRLAIAGNVNLRGASLHDLPEDAVALGGVTEEELKALYRHALCLAFPSYYEGFGIPPLEAMACGCPAAVAQTSSLPEVCGAAALYCDPHDPATLAAAIRRLIEEPGLRERLVGRGLNRSREFTWASSAERLLDLLEGLDRSPGSRALGAAT